MKPEFWSNKWQSNEIGFHLPEPNPLLTHHFQRLSLAGNRRVFLPLCGKTRDIAWLLDNGYQVAGAELIVSAVEQLFTELRLEPQIQVMGELTRYSADHIDIYAGHIFELCAETLGPVSAIYDRAALVALPESMRNDYTAHLVAITHGAPQLLISFEYDQSQLDGPPFSVSKEEVSRHYSARYNIRLLESTPVAGGLKGRCEATENVWLLERR